MNRLFPTSRTAGRLHIVQIPSSDLLYSVRWPLSSKTQVRARLVTTTTADSGSYRETAASSVMIVKPLGSGRPIFLCRRRISEPKGRAARGVFTVVVDGKRGGQDSCSCDSDFTREQVKRGRKTTVLEQCQHMTDRTTVCVLFFDRDRLVPVRGIVESSTRRSAARVLTARIRTFPLEEGKLMRTGKVP